MKFDELTGDEMILMAACFNEIESLLYNLCTDLKDCKRFDLKKSIRLILSCDLENAIAEVYCKSVDVILQSIVIRESPVF